jgi:AcrR family transcriptional regulator
MYLDTKIYLSSIWMIVDRRPARVKGPVRLNGTMTTSSRETSAGADRRTRKRQERREKVYETAVRLFVERGYENTSMDDIADEADVARGTVFNYFERKSALVQEWADRRRTAALAAVDRRVHDDASTADIVSMFIEILAEASTTARQETVAFVTAANTAMRIASDPELGHDLAKQFERGQRRGEIRQDIRPLGTGMLLAAGYFQILGRWATHDPEPFDLNDELAEMVGVVLRGALAT